MPTGRGTTKTKGLIVALVLILAAAAAGGWYMLLGPGAAGRSDAPGKSAGDQPLTAELPAAPGATPAPSTPSAPAPSAEPQEQFGQAAVIDDPNGYTNVYGGPSPVAPIVARVSAGESFSTYDQGGDWWRVRTAGGLIGYMPRSRIRLSGAAAPVPAAAQALATAPADPSQAATAPAPAPKAQRPRPRPSRINRANSANMRAFCQDAGRGTPQCRQFRRDLGGR